MLKAWNKLLYTPKKILLIIDPQNDFSIEKEGFRKKNGPLGVPGSSDDYERIAQLIKANIFDEIHISLDTHTPYHIGHKGFYKKNPELDNIKVCKPWESNFKPNNEELTDYVKNYAEAQKRARDTTIEYCIWDTHCLEGTEGHEIVKEIKEALSTDIKAKVRYHIKGQNELTEMYSIFSAAVQPNEVDDTIMPYLYSGTKQEDEYKYNPGEGVESYEEAIKCVNLETHMNTPLLANLFGDNNQIFVCGQAKTHCVKDSVLDMIKYAKTRKNKEESMNQIHLIANMTSVIPKFDDDIETILQDSGGNTGDIRVDSEQKIGEKKGKPLRTGGGKRRTKKQKKLNKKKTRKYRKTRKNKKSHKH